MIRLQKKAPLILGLSFGLALTAQAAPEKKPTAPTDPQPRGCITNTDGKPGQDNSADNSGNGGAGGTIVNADPGSCATANGGDGGNHNKGKNSGNGGRGGTIQF